MIFRCQYNSDKQRLLNSTLIHQLYVGIFFTEDIGADIQKQVVFDRRTNQ